MLPHNKITIASQQEREKWLGQLPFFQNLPADLAEEIAGQMRPREVATGALLMMEEQNTPSVCIIVRGTVKVSRLHMERETLLNIAGPGEILGEISLLDNAGHTADITVLEPTLLLWISRDVLLNLVETRPPLAYNLSLVLTRRLRLATSRIEALATLDVQGRIAHLLLSFAAVYGEVENNKVSIPLCLTQSDLASLSGATRTRVNQAIGIMRRNGLLDISKEHHYTLLDVERLKRRIEGTV